MNNQSKSTFERPLPLVLVGILALSVCFTSLLALWFLASSGQIAAKNAGDDSIRIIRPARAQYITETPAIVALQSAPTPTADSLSLPAASPLPKATPTATQVVAPVTPTSSSTQTPTPTPIPTATSLPTNTPIPTPTPVKIEHVVIISIDGLRPDALDYTDTPTLDYLISIGAYSRNAKTVQPSATLISHASMLGGMTPDKHGIYWNIYNPDLGKVKGPTLFSEAHQAGLRIAMVVGKIKLEHLVLPNSVDNFFDVGPSDFQAKNQAIALIQGGLPNILFIHLPETDVIGHEHGWMSPEQLQAVTLADGFIGEIRYALENGGYLNNTLLIVTADHGGNGTGHFDVLPQNFTIPWLAVGPGVPAGMTLTSEIDTYDTAATALYALNLPIPGEWDGKPISELFN